MLCADEIREAIKLILGEDATEELVSSMIDAIDSNADGQIDEQEWNQILARI